MALLGRGDAFGRGLTAAAERALKAAGADIAASIIYDPQQSSFDAEVQQLVAAKPQAIIVIGYDERGKILRSMIERGIGPKNLALYTTGVLSTEFWKSVNPADPAVIEKVKQTAAPRVSNNEFVARLQALQPALKSTQFAAEQYDCMIITALAASAAKSPEAATYKAQTAAVTKGEAECSSYADCLAKLATGKSIAYVGPSGPTRLSAVGDTTMARFQIYVVDAMGQSQPLRQVQVGAR